MSTDKRQYIAANIILSDDEGIHLFPSNSKFEPTSSANAVPQITFITSSATANQIIHTDELNPFIRIPILSGSNTADGLDHELVLRYYSPTTHLPNTPTIDNSQVDISLVNLKEGLFFTGSGDPSLNSRLYFLNIAISSSQTAATVRTETYNLITGSVYYGVSYSASLNSNSIKIVHFRSGSLPSPTIYTASIDDDSFNFHIEQTGSGLLNFVENRTLNNDSASLSLKRDPNDLNSIMFAVGTSSFSHSGSNQNIPMYISGGVGGKGRIGYGTKDPKTKYDFKGDGFKIRSEDGTRELKFEQDGRLSSKKYANSSTSESVGSTLQLSYTPGTFNTPTKARVGETIGTINWVDESFNTDAFFLDPAVAEVDSDKYLITGSIAQITSTVRSVTEVGAGGDLELKVNPTPGEPTEALVSFLTINPLSYNGVYFPYGLTTPMATKVTLGYISQSGGTTVDNTFDSNIILDNNLIIQGKTTAGTARNMIFMGPNDVVQVGATAQILGLRSSGRIQLTGSLYGAESDIAKIRNITASGDISASAGIILGGVRRTTWPSGTSIWYDGTTYISSSLPIKVDSHITASGNISASGDLSTFGEVVHLEGTDPRLKLKAKGANHPGIEWHEDSTRKWILYSDPDSSQGANDNLTWKNASDTELMELDQDGMLYVSSKIVHLDDTDTYINFTTDDINFQAGGQNMIDLTSGSQSEITFNEAGIDIDFRVEGDTDTKLFFTDAGNDKVGIGTNSPGEKLEVIGNISASGDITASGFMGTINGGSF
jgi:hypothetical protein